MKKTLIILLFVLSLITFTGVVLAENEQPIPTLYNKENLACTQEVKLCEDGSYVSRNQNNACEFDACPNNKEKNEEENEYPIVSASCGTVTPGYQNECCQKKGYESWDEEKFECIGEKKQEKDQNRVGAINPNKKTNLTQEQIQNIIRTRNRIKINYANQSECPEECTCSGSTLKCGFENGTRVMTVYAGNSGNMIVQVKGINSSTNVTLYKGENDKVYGTFRNNETKEIHLPDEIKEKLQNQTRTRLYNESINLTEDGYYHLEGKKKARLFWLIPVKEHVHAEVNAETGETIKVRNSWWGFMARDVKEKNNSED